MTRPLIILAALAPLISAQTAVTPETSPIEVTGRISQNDLQLLDGIDGPGLFVTVRNASTKAIQGYVYEIFFTDPATGKNGGHFENSVYKEPSKGVALTAGELTEFHKPFSFPITPSGGRFTQYSFKVDLVVFDDGSNWGPGQSRKSRKRLANLSGAK